VNGLRGLFCFVLFCFVLSFVTNGVGMSVAWRRILGIFLEILSFLDFRIYSALLLLSVNT
jgi:hypothetical protein